MPMADCVIAALEEVAAGADEEVEEPVADTLAEPLAEAVRDACADDGKIDTLSPVAFVQETLVGIETLLLKMRSAH